jgi:hypothetical protein
MQTTIRDRQKNFIDKFWVNIIMKSQRKIGLGRNAPMPLLWGRN